MASEAVSILTKKYDENNINIEIENKYKEIGLSKPKIMVFDSIPVCRLAYKLLLIYLNNYGKNLTLEHLVIPGKINNLTDFKAKSDKDILRDASRIFGRIHTIIRLIEGEYRHTNDISYLLDFKTQFLKDLRPPSISEEKWKFASESTKNMLREKVFDSIIKSNKEIFEFKLENYTNYICCDGILFGIFLKDFCILCKNPKLIIEDELNRLNSTDGFAIEMADKKGLYFVHGIQFDKELYYKIFLNKTINGKEVLNIKNVEQRAIAIQFFGYDNLIHELGAKLLDTRDEFSTLDNMPISYELYEYEMKVGRFEFLRKFRFVKVEDYSTHKKVTLGVPVIEQTSTCIGAIAWTFGMKTEEYKPEVQT